jgi:hypothetical protein
MSDDTLNPRLLTTARAGFGAVVAAAGVSGAALFFFPDSTGSFFSWGLGPPPLAALVGGLYLASSVVFAYAMRLDWLGIRSLLAAAVGLTAPTLVATLLHLDVFDFGRWQAWAWVALFVSAPPFWGGLLWAGPRPERSERRSLGLGSVLLAVVLFVWATVMWAAPEAASELLSYDLAGLGGRFFAAWLVFLGVMAAWSAFRPDERLPPLSLAAYSTGALVAGLRTFSDLAPGGRRIAYLVVPAALAVAYGVAAARRPSPTGDPSSAPDRAG